MQNTKVFVISCITDVTYLRVEIRLKLPNFSGRMRNITCISLLTMITLWSGSAALAQNNSPYTTSGLGSLAGIVSNQDKQPVAGIEVSATASWYAFPSIIITTTTDISGTYKIPFVPPGNYYLQFRDLNGIYGTQFYTNSEVAESSVKVQVMGNHQVGLNVNLQPGGHITGVVSYQGEPPPSGTNLYVTLELLQNEQWYGAGNAIVITSTGEYLSNALLPGSYRICANSQNSINYDYFSLCYPTEVVLSTTATIPNINLDLAQSNYNGSISGMVTGDGLPLANVQVDLYSDFFPTSSFIHTFTDSHGRYRFLGLGGNYYSLEFRDPLGQYAAFRYPDSPPMIEPAGKYIPLFGNQQITDLDIALLRAATITGTVWKSNGEPFPNAEIIAYWPHYEYQWHQTLLQTTSDSKGQYSLGGLYPGTYRLAFRFCLTQNNCEELLEFFGSTMTGNNGVYLASDLKLQPGQVMPNINLVLGPDPQLYLPLIQR